MNENMENIKRNMNKGSWVQYSEYLRHDLLDFFFFLRKLNDHAFVDELEFLVADYSPLAYIMQEV